MMIRMRPPRLMPSRMFVSVRSCRQLNDRPAIPFLRVGGTPSRSRRQHQKAAINVAIRFTAFSSAQYANAASDTE